MSCFIIAEAGVNHNGDIGTAYKLCEVAKKAGADAVKFQIFQTDKLVTKDAKKANYQNKNDKTTSSQYEMLKKVELSYEDFQNISNYCKQIDIKFMATAFDEESLDFLFSLGVDVIKIPSGEITNLPYLMKVAKKWKRIIMSTGMATLDEIKEAYNVLISNGAKVTVLHCTTEYPAPFETVNLKAMEYLGNELGVKYGYSDHTRGIVVAIAAVALGATVIEKHFTLDKTMDGPDHKASIEPKELAEMVEAIRNIELSLGVPQKLVSAQEKDNRIAARKSIVANCDISKGELLTEKNLTTKRPGNGISPMRWLDIIGTKAKKDFKEGDLIVI